MSEGGGSGDGDADPAGGDSGGGTAGRGGKHATSLLWAAVIAAVIAAVLSSKPGCESGSPAAKTACLAVSNAAESLSHAGDCDTSPSLTNKNSTTCIDCCKLIIAMRPQARTNSCVDLIEASLAADAAAKFSLIQSTG